MYCHSERSEESPENKLAMRFFVVTLLRMTHQTLISVWKLINLISPLVPLVWQYPIVFLLARKREKSNA
jgi:hypothetical protein